MKIHRRVTGVFLLLAAFLCSRELFADDCVWNGATGNWTDVVSWNTCGGSFPGAADNAAIPSGSVSLTGSQAVTNLTLSGGTLGGAGI